MQYHLTHQSCIEVLSYLSFTNTILSLSFKNYFPPENKKYLIVIEILKLCYKDVKFLEMVVYGIWACESNSSFSLLLCSALLGERRKTQISLRHFHTNYNSQGWAKTSLAFGRY